MQKLHPSEIRLDTEEVQVSLLVEAEEKGPKYVAALNEQMERQGYAPTSTSVSR